MHGCVPGPRLRRARWILQWSPKQLLPQSSVEPITSHWHVFWPFMGPQAYGKYYISLIGMYKGSIAFRAPGRRGGGAVPRGSGGHPRGSGGAQVLIIYICASTGAVGAANYLCCVRLDVPTYIIISNCYVRGSLPRFWWVKILNTRGPQFWRYVMIWCTRCARCVICLTCTDFMHFIFFKSFVIFGVKMRISLKRVGRVKILSITVPPFRRYLEIRWFVVCADFMHKPIF